MATAETPRPSTRIPLDAGWTLHRVGADGAGPVAATVPGCVHTDLLAAGVIPDPFVDANELDVAWVADADWTYRTVVPPADGRDRTDLVFAGLDTLAEVAIDGVDVARTANMHRSYRFDVTTVLGGDDAHDLTVTFRSATRAALAARDREGPWPSSSFGRPFNYVRKMACSWGWDWGPSLTTAGIWRPVVLHGWDAARLASVRPAVTVAGNHGRIVVSVSVERTRPIGLAADIDVADAAGVILGGASTTIPPAANTVAVELDVDGVERWWPAGQGAQPLYTLSVRLRTGDDDPGVLDEWRRRIGFRTIELDTRPDATGAAFTFVVNDRPMFARGVNWIPDDPFPSRVTPQRYRERLRQAADANVDLVRVWGGGIFEDDAFYDACDELGLLVWQDFLFACAAYPETLLGEEVEAEAGENVERLMAHPSLALWNGNNENLWGYVDWGWQPALGDRPWGAGFYLDVLPRVVADVDPGRPYWPGSPYSGSMTVHPNADAHGCVHEWNVWNRVDHTRYRDRTPRLVAEFGWQAPPTWATLRGAVTDEPLTPTSPGMLHHQKAEDGNGKLERGLAHHFEVPGDIDAWLWAMQLNQARAVRTGVEHFRSLRGTCMGTIWWQLNDCWPVTSWALVDGGGRRKPAWYAMRDAYASRLLTIQPRGAELALFAVNDGDTEWDADVTVARWTFAGEQLAAADTELGVGPRSIASWVVPRAVATPGDAAAEALRVVGGDTEAWWWFDVDRRLRYPAAEVEVERAERVDEATLRLTIRAGTLVRDLVLLADRADPALEVDHQLTSMLPGETATLTVTSAAGSEPLDRLAAMALSPPLWWTANDLVMA